MSKKNKKNDYLFFLLFFLLGIITRVPFVEKIQSHMDGPQYSIGVIRYSFEQSTPEAPGYPLYIGLGMLFNLLFNDPYKSILAVSILGSALGAAILFYLGLKIYHKNVGIAAAIIFLSGSTFYYLGLTAYAFLLIVPTTALLAYAVYRIFVLQKDEGVFLGLIFGICLGIRPQEILQIVTLFGLGFVFLSNKEKVKTIIFFMLVTLSWLIPVINSVGLNEFLGIFSHSSELITTRGTLLTNLTAMVKGFLLSFGISAIFLLYFLRFIKKGVKKATIFFTAWIFPGLLINLIFFSDHAGYQMSYLTGFLILISYAIWKSVGKNKLLFILTLILISGFNLYWFFYNRDPNFDKPYRFLSFHYSEIVKNDIKIGGKIKFIQKNFDPKTTLIVTNALYFRQYMYYLKNYQVTDIEAIDTNIPKFMYVKRDGKNWNRREYTSKDFSVLIAANIKNIIFTDDYAKDYIKKYPVKVYVLPGKSTITFISVPKNVKMFYKYHFVEIKKL